MYFLRLPQTWIRSNTATGVWVNEVVERSEGYGDATICSPFLFFLNACLHRQATVPRITPKVTVMQGSHTPPCLIMAKLIQITGQPSVTEPGTRVAITLDCDIFFFICFCIYSSSLCVVYVCVYMWKRTYMHVRVEARGRCQMSSWAILCLMKLGLLRSLSWLTNEIQGSTCLGLPRAGSQTPPLCLALECLGSKLSSSHLHNKRLTRWATFLVPFFRTLSLFRSLIVQSVIDCLLWSLKGEGTVRAEWELALLYLEELQSSGRQLMLN